MDSTPYNPIPRLQQVREDILSRSIDAPETSARYIELAIKEIERLTEQRDVGWETVRLQADDIDRLRMELYHGTDHSTPSRKP